MEGNKVTTYAVVALVVGILVGVGVGYAAFHGSNNNNDSNTDDTYWFYLYFGDNHTDTGWYSATAENSSVAFDKAMKDAGLEYDGSSGYPSKIGETDSYWFMAHYLYTDTTADAASNSILGVVENSWGSFALSNGWVASAGYDSGDGLKLWEINANIFYFSVYNADYTFSSPVDSYGLWSVSGPFATA